MTRPANDQTTSIGRSGLTKRLAERDHVLVVGRIVKADEGGAYVRRATLDDLKRAAKEGER